MKWRVFVKAPGAKRGQWLAAGGRTTTLLIHASLFDEREVAESYVADIEEHNQGHTAEVREVE